MRIYEIASGRKIDMSNEYFDEVRDRIKIECSDAYRAYQNTKTALYRGVKVNDGLFSGFFKLFKPKQDLNIYLGKPRENRKPLGSDSYMQRAFDEVFQEKGFTALRSNSIFCTGSSGMAGDFGRTYIIFPKNGFSFTWSPSVKDLYVETRGTAITSREYKANPAVLKQKVEEFVDSRKYSNTNFEEALLSRNEILVNGEFYATDYEKHHYFWR